MLTYVMLIYIRTVNSRNWKIFLFRIYKNQKRYFVFLETHNIMWLGSIVFSRFNYLSLIAIASSYVARRRSLTMRLFEQSRRKTNWNLTKLRPPRTPSCNDVSWSPRLRYVSYPSSHQSMAHKLNINTKVSPSVLSSKKEATANEKKWKKQFEFVFLPEKLKYQNRNTRDFHIVIHEILLNKRIE